MENGRVERCVEGTLAHEEMTAVERAVDELVRKSVVAPARLGPNDLEPLVREMGLGAALEIVAMIGAFHYINRIAELVGVEHWLPPRLRGWRWLRRAGLGVQTRLVALGMDFSSRRVAIDPEAELAGIERLRGGSPGEGPLPSGYRQMTAAPSLAAYTRAMMSGLARIDADLHRQVARAVAAALPAGPDEAPEPPPAEPIGSLAAVATRRPAAVTAEMVDAVRRRHRWTDAELTDLFYLIAVRNDLERFDRLLAEPVAAG